MEVVGGFWESHVGAVTEAHFFMRGSHVDAIFNDFCRFLEIFGGLWAVFASHVGFHIFLTDFGGFWSILGEFWEALLEPFRRPRRMKIAKKAIFVQFLQASKMNAILEAILGQFPWRLDRQK